MCFFNNRVSRFAGPCAARNIGKEINRGLLNDKSQKSKRKNSVYFEKYPYFLKNKGSFSAYMIQIFGFGLIWSS
jgi:hypothetical protein